MAGPSERDPDNSAVLDDWSGDPQEILAIFDGAQPLDAECSRPEEWTISVDDGEWGWVIVSQLADPQWQAHWIGLDGQGEYDVPILPTFRKENEPGGWQRVEVPGPGRWTLRLNYDAHDVVDGDGDLDHRVGLLDIGSGFDRLSKCVRSMASHRDNSRPRRNVTTKIGVAIVGASGYAARELIRILLNHPHVEITAATSRQDEAPRLESLHPSLARRIDLTCEAFDADRVAQQASFAFLALPHTASMAVVPALRQRGVRVIDLSADYRLTDPQIYADWYGHAHTDPEGLRTAVYGLPELFRDRIPPVELIANPGCYTSASILALAPLIAEDLIERQRDHHRRQERGVRGGPFAQADVLTSPNATRACRPTASASTGTRRRSTRY